MTVKVFVYSFLSFFSLYQLHSNYISTKSHICFTDLFNSLHSGLYLFFYSKCSSAVIEVSTFSGKAGELIKNTARCCQPQVSAYWIVRYK